MICNSCKTLTIHALYQAACDRPPGSKTGWNQSGYLTLHPSFSSLISSSQNGCPNCTLYLHHFSKTSPKQLQKYETGNQEPVIAFLVIANWVGGKQYITKLQFQIGTKPWRAGDEGERVCVAFRISRPRRKFAPFKSHPSIY
jgi:hypothetical protein